MFGYGFSSEITFEALKKQSELQRMGTLEGGILSEIVTFIYQTPAELLSLFIH